MKLNEKYEILNAKFSDLNDIVRIERENFPCPWKKEYFESELCTSMRYNRVFIIYPDKSIPKLVGYLFSHYVHDELHIAKIATDKSYQRKGIATLLMEDCILFCIKKKINLISLEVRVSNYPAINFYEKFDFKKLYIRKKYYPDGEDAFFMIKDLKIK